MDPGDDIAVAYGDKNRQGRVIGPFTHLLVQFAVRLLPPFPYRERGSLLAPRRERIVARVAAVPAKLVRGFDRQIERVVIRSIHQNDLRPINEQLRDLGWRGGPGGDDYRLLPPRRGAEANPRAARRRAKAGENSTAMHACARGYPQACICL